MKIILFGTPDYVIPILEKLHRTFKTKDPTSGVVAVVTQSAKPTGRKKTVTFSPVDAWAHTKNIAILYRSEYILMNKIQADIGVLASYGAKIPQEVINHFPHGILVIHPSLLPEFRWSSPVPAALVTNTNPTGVTIIKMDGQWDHGPIVTQIKENILDTDTYQNLRDRLFANSAEVVCQTLPAYIAGKIRLKSQDDSKATYARMITKDDAFIPPKYLDAATKGFVSRGKWKIDFIKPTYNLQPTTNNLDRFIRAMDPWPGAWTLLRLNSSGQAKRLKILKSHLQPTRFAAKRATNNLQLVLDEVQLEGKNPVSWRQFKEAHPLFKF